MDCFTGASLNLEKLFSRSSFYATISSENIFRSSSIDDIVFNCGPLIMDTSLVLEDFFGGSRISPRI